MTGAAAVVDASPVLVWLRRDLRLADHSALTAACAIGRPVIPVFILDPQTESLAAAPKWRLGAALGALASKLAARGSRLILRRGDALEVLQQLVAETGAGAVYWSRLYDPQSRARDATVKTALKSAQVEARSFPGHLLFEPWTVATQTGTPFRMFTPMWRAVRGRDVAGPIPEPGRIPAPHTWPAFDRLADWRLGEAMHRGAAVVAGHSAPGEDAGCERLFNFLSDRVDTYKEFRDRPDLDATSGLAEYLSLGEVAVARCWQDGLAALAQGKQGAEAFLRQLAWRDFAHHLMYHNPHILDRNWRSQWDGFPWNTDPDHPHVTGWKQGRTGIRLVDAAMREMHVTGRMHNRARMVVASYLTKHLLTHWRIGQDWFAEHLTDWDPANNAMGWQWVAGPGPDAAPYFRIFNPDTQAKKFDPDGTYVRRWIAEGQRRPPDTALAYFNAVPRAWGLALDDAYPDPVVSLAEGRAAALRAYESTTSTSS